VLGVGVVRALRALGLAPTVFHMNEGHSAFLALERLRELMEQSGRIDLALDEGRSSTVFTTHTPVPAGNEVFDRPLVERYLAPLAGEELRDAFLALGTVAGEEARFTMTPLALRTTAYANGVSRLHGEVARGMWAGLAGSRPRPAPIGHVTNGVHPGTWLAPALAAELQRAGVRPGEAPDSAGWQFAHDLSDEALWALHQERKRVLVEAAARHAAEGGHPAPALSEDAFTIGFARRFATYKRADLLFSLPDRLHRLLADAERPVQVLLAGKAHPHDDAGKALIQQIVRFARESGSEGRVVFLPGYDIGLAQLLVQGSDLWLNTPRRPMEASGTSGMKAALNGVPNCSVLDGWWDEAFTPAIGFAIGDRTGTQLGEAAKDLADAGALHALLADEVVPLYFRREGDGVPREWLRMMRSAIAAAGQMFTSQRMLCDYVERYYLPAHRAR
jgi:starch phosphorylase